MLPYPSGEPHIGHLKVYSIGDAIAHYKRRGGFRVMQPMGYDAFGLPAENNAIKTGVHPRDATNASIAVLPALVPALGDLDRLDPRARHQRPRLLPLDAVDLPQDAGARARLPQGGGGEVVPQGRHRAGQRAGDRRQVRALRHPSRGPPARAVVLPDHRLRRPPARRPRRDRLARAREDDAAQLDRALRGRRGDLPLRGAGDRLSGVHDAPGHAVRRHLLRARPRASRRLAPRRRHPAGGARARVRQPGDRRVCRGARRRGAREDRRAARAARSPTR